MSQNLITVIESGLARCRLEPRGASDLDQVYRFERCEDGKGRYYRAYPDGGFPGYHETCGERVFAEYYEPVEIPEAATEQSRL
jgi:hypothetical protein